MGENFGYRQLFRIGPVNLCWVGSWDRPFYSRFGAWRNDGGFSLRYRAYILRVR